MRNARVAIAAVLAATAACGGGAGGSGSTPASVTLDDVLGTWHGSWVSASGVQQGSLWMGLSMPGNWIAGWSAFTGSPCLVAGDVAADLNGSVLQGVVGAWPTVLNFSVAVGDGTAVGSYEVIDGACAGDSGTFTLTKSPAAMAPEAPRARIVLVADDGQVVGVLPVPAR